MIRMHLWAQKMVLHSHLLSHISNSFHMHLIFPLQKHTGRAPWNPEAGVLFSVLREKICPYLQLRFQAQSSWAGWNCAWSQPQPFFAAQRNLELNHCAKPALLQPPSERPCKPHQSLHRRLQNYWCNRNKSLHDWRAISDTKFCSSRLRSQNTLQ